MPAMKSLAAVIIAAFISCSSSLSARQADDSRIERVENDLRPYSWAFRLNTEWYPQSSNTYDSLGEAYMKAGDRALAMAGEGPGAPPALHAQSAICRSI